MELGEDYENLNLKKNSLPEQQPTVPHFTPKNGSSMGCCLWHKIYWKNSLLRVPCQNPSYVAIMHILYILLHTRKNLQILIIIVNIYNNYHMMWWLVAGGGSFQPEDWRRDCFIGYTYMSYIIIFVHFSFLIF